LIQELQSLIINARFPAKGQAKINSSLQLTDNGSIIGPTDHNQFNPEPAALSQSGHGLQQGHMILTRL
jgi:hypothetical protein